MKHLNQEQIVLHYYGDAAGESSIERHLQECAGCREEFERVKAVLEGIPATEVPEPQAYLEEKIWLNVRDRLPERRRSFFIPRWAITAAMAVLVVAAFMAGHYWPRHAPVNNPAQSAQVNPQRVLLVAVGDHLERSQMLLIEIMNTDTKDPIDLGDEQQQARNLLDSNRLYRVSAQRAGDPAVARTLDELERVLTEIANSPQELTARDVEEIRNRIQSQDLLFKIRVVGSKVQQPIKTENQRL
jgi:hypothetical protein